MSQAAREICLKVRLGVRGPVLSRSSEAGAVGVDQTASRVDDRLLLPASLVQGKLREAWGQIHDAAGADFDPPTVDLFGEEAANPSDDPSDRGFEPCRGRLRFSDFVASRDLPEKPPRMRVRIDGERGSVFHGALAALDSPVGAGVEIDFCGTIRFFSAREDEAADVARWVRLGLGWLDTVGAGRSLGFGRLVSMKVEESDDTPRTPTPESEHTVDVSEDGLFDLVLRLESPMLMARLLPQGNLFESRRRIPGAALKGALATTWRERCGLSPNGPVGPETDPQRPELGRHFAALRFTDAVLGRRDGPRPFVPPFSAVRAAGRIFDLAHHGPCLLRDATSDGRHEAPRFWMDWKGRERSAFESKLGWGTPRFETRVRTAIDSRTRKGADGRLFVYRAIQSDDGQAFFARADLSRVPAAERGEVAKQLLSLLAEPLRHVGKTKATVSVEARDYGSIKRRFEEHTPAAGEPWILALQTPALLLEPGRLHEETSSGEELREAYGEAFRDLAGDGLALRRLYARQELAGGSYLWQRFHRDRPYEAHLLTAAGSVFVFDPPPREIGQELQRWARHGLPLPSWVRSRWARTGSGGQDLPGDDWRRCPFLPQNGFGEVALNAELHWSPEHRPDPQQMVALEVLEEEEEEKEHA